MKRTFRSSLFPACAVAATLGLGLHQPVALANFHNMPGSACAAFNNAQADALERSHVRIYNPSTNFRSLYVICPLQRDLRDLEEFPNAPVFYVTAFFSAEAATGTQVSCIFREFDNQTTHVPGDGQGGTDQPLIFNVQGINMAKTAGVGTSQAVASGEVFANINDSTQNFYTFTCLLPPGTGINEYDVEQI